MEEEEEDVKGENGGWRGILINKIDRVFRTRAAGLNKQNNNARHEINRSRLG